MINLIMKLLIDPKLFNYLIMALNIFAALRWTYHGSYWNALYWASAFTLTLAVTAGLKH